MIEAVGERYWPDYFGAIDRMLAEGGRMSLQAITMAHDRLLATRNGYTWVHKYVFPGGALPSMTAIDQVVGEHTTLRIQETRRLGLSYVPTLQQWRHNFNDRLPEVRALGFDETFVRMWNFYLAYSRGRVRRRLPRRPADRVRPGLSSGPSPSAGPRAPAGGGSGPGIAASMMRAISGMLRPSLVARRRSSVRASGGVKPSTSSTPMAWLISLCAARPRMPTGSPRTEVS